MDLKTSLAALLILLLMLPTLATAETECTPAIPGDCTITITINIAFSYNQNEVSPQQVQGWVDQIEDVWNGPTGSQTYGDCGCEVKFEVNHIKITDPAQVNCNPGPEGYHCIMVTDYSTKPPKDTQGNTYRAYMYGVSENGTSEKGWWSDIVGDPHPDSPTGENALDAAHEAGHMMGLDDDYDKGPPERHGNNIMGTTHGPDAKPTQDQIDQVVENICGDDACPDECCCGNGVIEEDKGETCDPFLDPTGCEENTYCCKICCNCHEQICNPDMGSYATEEDCQSACRDGQCLFNYETGCWDCVEYETVITPSPPPETPVPPTSGSPADSTSPESPASDSPIPEPPVLMDGGIDISNAYPFVLVVVGLILLIAGLAFKSAPVAAIGIVLSLSGVAIYLFFVSPEMLPISPPAPAAPGEVPGIPGVTAPEVPTTAQELFESPEPQPSGNVDEAILQVPELPEDVPPTGGSVEASVCGDGTCDDDEDCGTCEDDCGACGPVCGDGICDIGETCSTCGADCGCSGSEICGITDANPTPHCMSPPDCEEPCYLLSGAPCSCDAGHCGCPSGTVCCDPDDDDCDADKFGCAPEEEEPSCGDGVCDEGFDEDCYTCSEDCGSCCGNGVCDEALDEDCETCEEDCGECEPYCGDGLCMPEIGEDCECVDCEDACPIGMVCDPDNPLADPLGCIPEGDICGDGSCQESENCYTCPDDCASICFDQGLCCIPGSPGMGCGECGPVDV